MRRDFRARHPNGAEIARLREESAFPFWRAHPSLFLTAALSPPCRFRKMHRP